MTAKTAGRKKRTWTASELRRMPSKKRDAILRAAAARAEKLYRTDPELTAFEAFGEDDLYGISTATREGRDLDRTV